ncbi:hypothetical protein AB4114_11015 [Paenibacillus sp. 2RAB27]|uniref:hypothetical protein n=1 Tax=Paenibacillus sp. 2RAB27 TaxID=3232991 RepID=UPI003F98CBB7
MKIYSKATLQFDHPTQAEAPVIVRHESFGAVPDWVKESKMFKLALSDETITVIESKEDEIKAEHGNTEDDEKAAAKAAAKAAKEAEKKVAAEKAEADALALAAGQQ